MPGGTPILGKIPPTDGDFWRGSEGGRNVIWCGDWRGFMGLCGTCGPTRGAYGDAEKGGLRRDGGVVGYGGVCGVVVIGFCIDGTRPDERGNATPGVLLGVLKAGLAGDGLPTGVPGVILLEAGLTCRCTKLLSTVQSHNEV